MPCIKPARGSAPGAQPPLSPDENNPCGKAVVGAVAGVDMTAHQLCVFHLGMKLGLAGVRAPISIESPGLMTAKRKSTARRTKKSRA